MKIIYSLSLSIILLTGACSSSATELPITYTSTQKVFSTTEAMIVTPTIMPRPRPKPNDDLGFIKGMSFVSWSEEAYGNPLADQALEDLAQTGTTWVAIIANTLQKDNNSTEIDTLRNSDESIIHAIQKAHSLNLNIMLKPHVDFSADTEHWRGQIGQNFDATQWDQWFNSYSKMILHYAKLAEENGVEMFCIGTELNIPQQQTALFQKLVEDVRMVFSGPITYASNWDAYEHEWWSSVDYIGVDAYFPLTDTRAPTIDQVVNSWAAIVPKLESVSKKWNRPLIFTEIGYSSQEYAARTPAGEENGLVDPQIQANIYQATFDAFRDKSWFKGMFWWMWEDTSYAGGMCDYHHTPKDKLAENVLRAEYGVNPTILQGAGPLPIFDEKNITTYPIFMDSYGKDIDLGWSWGLSEKVVNQPVFIGENALEINYQGWSGFSPHLHNVDTTFFKWLEFYIYTPKDISGSLIVNVADVNDYAEYKQSITRCNYFDNTDGIKPEQWNRILIPLEQINADNRIISRVVLEYWNGEPITIWIDEMRLVGLK